MRWTALILLTGCAADPTLTTWVPLDVDALVDTLDNPTATVAEFQAKLAGVESALPPYDAEASSMNGVLGPQLSTDPLDDPYVEPDEDGEVPSTGLFLRIACPGLNAEAGPDPAFGHGYVQIESPLLNSEDDTDLLQGDLYVTVKTCQFGDRVSDGAHRAVWVAEGLRLFADGNVLVSTPDPVIEGLPEEVRIAASPDGLRFSLPVGGAYAVASRGVDDAVVTIDLADGTATCVVDPEPHCTVTAAAAR